VLKPPRHDQSASTLRSWPEAMRLQSNDGAK
jgi:hypothetical protein